MSSEGTVDRPEQRMLTMQLPGRRKRGRPEKRFNDIVKEETQRVGVTEEVARDSVRQRKVTCCG